ncbi:5'-nucleotidase [Borrelia sp. RT5S]|uniref:5'-nucleotidase n=1 Tax=Borrelia sp. RT5S TaxID=2898581 RepID=UPI001E5E2AF1|nr:5'-nucleotidase [Borrelia sp. RT5S]UGQ16591.1 5'-nucleotidase [Borrelia sp. RT5S]
MSLIFVLIFILSVRWILNFNLVRNYLFGFISIENRKKIESRLYLYIVQNIINTLVYFISFFTNFYEAESIWFVNFNLLDMVLSFLLVFFTLINILGYYFLIYSKFSKALHNRNEFDNSYFYDMLGILFSFIEFVFYLGILLPFLKQNIDNDYIAICLGILIYSFMCLNSKMFLRRYFLIDLALNIFLYAIVFFYLSLNFFI